MARQGQARLLAALFIAVVLLFNFPVLAIIDSLQALSRFPIAFIYAFAIWALAIVSAAVILERRRD